MKDTKISEVLNTIHNIPSEQNLLSLMNQLGPKYGKLFEITMELYIMLLESIQADPEGVINTSISSQIESFLEAVNNTIQLTEDDLRLLTPIVAILIVSVKSSTLSFLFNHPNMQVDESTIKSKFIN